jgi:hypothetical protein
MLTEFQPEGFTDAESGSRQKCKEHFITAFCTRENLFDFGLR